MPKSTAAEYTSLSVEKFLRAVADRELPPAIKLRGKELWDRVAIDRRLDQLAAGEDSAWRV